MWGIMRKQRWEESTNYIHCGSAIGKPSGGSIKEVNSIWAVIGFSSCYKVVVVATIRQRVSKYEKTRHLWSCMSTILQIRHQLQ